MVVGVLTLAIHLPLCRSLKDKRRVIKSLADRLRGRHNISLAEVDAQDLWQRAVIGIAAVSLHEQHVQTLFEKITAEVESQIPGDIVDRSISFV
jgi:uncharacterized protein YlxP (DUF503 family)